MAVTSVAASLRMANAVGISAGDTARMLISTALVLLMVPGLAFFMVDSFATRVRSTPC